MNTRVKYKQQWQPCQRCGFMYPMSRLRVQKGLLVCTNSHCFDKLEVERRSLVIERTMAAGLEQEGVDLRQVDSGFFLGQQEEVF